MRTIVLASIAALLLASAADAQTAASTTAASKTVPASKTSTKASKPTVSSSASAPMAGATPTKATGGRKPQTAASKACSAQADAKNLHGKDREKFRRSCMKGSA